MRVYNRPASFVPLLHVSKRIYRCGITLRVWQAQGARLLAGVVVSVSADVSKLVLV
jgi:hypothetical protein